MGMISNFNLILNNVNQSIPKLFMHILVVLKVILKRVAFDILLQAETGFLSMTGNNKEYAKMPVALIDVLAAHQIKEGILTAIIQQLKTPKAIKVSTTLEETAIASLMNQSSNYLMAGHIAIPMGTLHPNIAPYGEIIETLDNEKLILAIGTDLQFQKFSKIIALEENMFNNFQKILKEFKNRSYLLTIINEKTRKFKSENLLAICVNQNIPVGKIKKFRKSIE